MPATIPNSQEITRAAELARPLFLRNNWTWRGEHGAPSELDLAATFSSLAWELDRLYGEELGRTRQASAGRLSVTRDSEGRYRYAVVLS